MQISKLVKRLIIPPEINSLDSEVEKCKLEIGRIAEEIKKLEATRKGDASSKLEELEVKVSC